MGWQRFLCATVDARVRTVAADANSGGIGDVGQTLSTVAKRDTMDFVDMDFDANPSIMCVASIVAA